MKKQALIITTAALIGLPLAFSDAHAKGAGIQVSPVLIDASVKKSGQVLQPITVKNTGGETIVVRMRFAPLGHSTSGGPSVVKGYRYAGDKLLKVNANNFKLRPGQSKQVRIKVNAPAARAGGAYAMMYVLGDLASKKRGSTVVAKTQVGVIFTLRMPGSSSNAMKARAVYATQEKASGQIKLFAGLKNNGDTHARASGTVTVSRGGRVIDKASVHGGMVFPGFSRYFEAKWKPRSKLAPGTYSIVSNLQAGGKKYTNKGSFTVLRRGELNRHKALIREFKPEPAVKNQPIHLTAVVVNQGNIPFRPVGRVAFRDKNGKRIGKAVLKASSNILVGRVGTLSGELQGGLPVGTYSAELKLTSGPALVLATHKTKQQVIAKRVVMKAKVASLLPPTKDKPFLTLEMVNQGNVTIDSEGVILVADSRGNVVGQVVLDKRSVRQGKSTSYMLGLPQGLSSGLYELRAMVNYGGSSQATKTIKHFIQ